MDLVTFEFNIGLMSTLLGDVSLREVTKRHWSDLPFVLDRVAQFRWRGRRILQAMRDLDPDVVLCHNMPAAAIVGPAELRARKVWYCHEPPRSLWPAVTNRALWHACAQGLIQDPRILEEIRELEKRHSRPGRALRRRRAFDAAGVARMDLLLANSVYSRTSIEQVYGRNDVEVVYPHVAFPEAVPLRQGLDRTGLNILVQSRLERMKNIETILRGVAKVRSGLGTRPTLHIVGNGKGKAGLQELTAELGIEDMVTFHGFLDADSLRDLRRACDVFALLPWDEPFGMVFPEAAAEGLLLIGPDHGGPLEILDQGALGVCVPAHSAEAFGEACLRLWATPDADLDRLRSRAYEACKARFSEPVTMERLHRLLARR